MGARSRFEQFARSTTVRGSLLLGGTTAFGQVVALGGLAAVSRAYSTESYGAYTVAIAVGSILSSVVSLRLERAIAVPPNHADALKIARLSLAVATCISAVVLGASLMLRDLLEHGIGRSLGLPMMLLIVVIAWSTSLYLVVSQLAIRYQAYVRIATRNVVHPATTVIAQLALSALTQRFGLLLGAAIGRLVGVLGLTRYLIRTPVQGKPTPEPPATYRSLIKKYWRFVAFGAPANLVNVANLQLPPILFAMAASVGLTGEYGVATMAVSAPAALVATAVGQVFLGTFADAVRTKSPRVLALYRKASWALGAIAVVCGSLVWLFSPLLFGALLPDDWDSVSLFAQNLAILMTARILAAPLSVVLDVLQKQGIVLVLDLLRLAVVLFSFVVLPGLGLSPGAIVLAYSLGSAIVYVVTWAVAYRCVRKYSDAS